MPATKPKCGFYANDVETFYVTPAGRIWIVFSPDYNDDSELYEMTELPADAESVDDLMTPDECLAHCREVEKASGEKLIED